MPTYAEGHSIAGHPLAGPLIAELQRKRQTLVLAESCTGGLIASLLTDIAGGSSVFAGSFVVYQNESKSNWLGVDAKTVLDKTPVCEAVAQQMAVGTLSKTSQATIAAAITGHLGPNAPEEQDGVVFIALSHATKTVVQKHQLAASTRSARKTEAAMLVLAKLQEFLDEL